MMRTELLEKVLAGRFAIVGEIRGWNAFQYGANGSEDRARKQAGRADVPR